MNQFTFGKGKLFISLNLIIATRDNFVSGKELYKFEGHTLGVTDIAFNDVGNGIFELLRFIDVISSFSLLFGFSN